MNVFPNRDCVCLVRPVTDEDQLQTLDSIPYESLRDKFREGMSILKDKVLKGLPPKLLFGKSINGRAFVNLAKTYVEAINTGAVPTIRNAWSVVSELECRHAIEASVEIYIKEMNSLKLPMEEEDLFKQHVIVKDKAIKEFQLMALGSDLEVWRDDLEKKMLEEFGKVQTNNNSESEKQCKSVLSDIHKDINSKSFKNLPDLANEWKKQINDTYFKTVKGKFKHITLSEFLKQQFADSMISLDQKIIDELREEQKKRIRTSSKRFRR